VTFVTAPYALQRVAAYRYVMAGAYGAGFVVALIAWNN